MPAQSCGYCLEWATSDDMLLDALQGQWRARERCDHQPVMHRAIEQFRKNQPFWWVVGSAVVVPVWVVERVTKRARMLASSADSTAYRADDAGPQPAPGSTGFARLLETCGVPAVPVVDLLDIGFERHGGKQWRMAARRPLQGQRKVA